MVRRFFVATFLTVIPACEAVLKGEIVLTEDLKTVIPASAGLTVKKVVILNLSPLLRQPPARE